MDIKGYIEARIKKAAKQPSLKGDFHVVRESSPDKVFKHGDYSINLLGGAKAGKSSPEKVGKILIKEFRDGKRLPEGDKRYFHKIDYRNPGYLNFTLSDGFLQSQLKEILESGDDYGKNNLGRNRKVLVEFISANPTGPITLGNGRGAFYGDVLANILSWSGYKTKREFFINNAKHSGQIRSLGKAIKGETDDYRESLHYVEEKLNFKELSGLDEEEAGFKLAGLIQAKNQKLIEEKLGINFDIWLSEQAVFYDSGEVKKIKNFLSRKDFTMEKEGALWLKSGGKEDDEDQVLVRSTGEPTYFLTDIAYFLSKYKNGFDKIINFWGADHHGHKKRVEAILKRLGKDTDKLRIIIMQLVRLAEGGREVKMSKRKSEFITLEELIDETGTDAARFFFLTPAPSRHLDFDLELAKKQSRENPVYYVQYAHARISAILRKIPDSKKVPNFSLLIAPSELNLIRKMTEFPELIEDISQSYNVHLLTHYCLDLAKTFHHFYHSDRVLMEDNEELTQVRAALIRGTQMVLRNCLNLMGISAPDKM